MITFGFPLLPPGAKREKDFLRRCICCGECAHICPWQCIRMERGWRRRNTPVIRPKEAPCRLCMKCPPICPAGALDNSVTEMTEAGMGRAVILKDKCYNFTSATLCWTCYDRCPLRGTAVVLENGLTPAVTDACAGCGVCEYVCPAQAVITIPREELLRGS